MTHPRTTHPKVSAATGFWLAAATYAALTAFTTIPTPLYALYQHADHFPTAMLTVIFSTYAVGVIVALWLFGHVSDWMGRRRIMLAAAGLEIVAALIFIASTQIAWLLVARFVSGFGIGLLSATATAYLRDLRGLTRPTAMGMAATMGGVANLGGLGLGPLFGGAMAEWFGHPLVLPYLVALVVLVLAAAAIGTIPETVARPAAPVAWHPQRVRVPPQHVAMFWAAGVGAFTAFAITGFYGSVAPAFLTEVVGMNDRLATGMTAFAVFAAAAVSQVVFARLRLRTQLVLGTAAMVVGMTVLAAGDVWASFPLFLLGGILGGTGLGLVFRGALATAGAIAAPEHRGEVLTGVFLLAFAGMAIPPVLVGVAVLWVPIVPAILGFVVLILALVLWAGPLMVRKAGAADEVVAPEEAEASAQPRLEIPERTASGSVR